MIRTCNHYRLLFLLCLLILTSCRKQVQTDHPEYIGEWLGYGSEYLDGQTISVDATGWGKYHSEKAGDGFSGKARSNNRTFSIGMHKFKILSTPTVTDTTVDELARSFYRYHTSTASPLMKMELETPTFWGNTSITFFKMR